MAHSWRIRIRLWKFALPRRIADLPFWFTNVRQFGLDDFPNLRTTIRFPSSTPIHRSRLFDVDMPHTQNDRWSNWKKRA
jgi:hypothetical protein